MTFPPYVSYDEAMATVYEEDPELASQMLNECLADNDREGFLIALRQITKAHGGISQVAEKTGLNEQTLYRTLSAKGNPELKTLMTLTHAMGLRMQFIPEPL